MFAENCSKLNSFVNNVHFLKIDFNCFLRKVIESFYDIAVHLIIKLNEIFVELYSMLRLPPSFTASGVCLYLFATELFVAPNFISFWISFQFLSTDNTRSHVCHVTVAAGRELIRMWQ